MATVQDVKGVNQTLIDAGGLVSQIAAGLDGGRLKVKMDEYTTDTNEASGSTIEFGGDLPAGAKIIAIVLAATVAQSSLTFLFGTQFNTDEFAVAGNTGLQTAIAPVVLAGRGYVVGTSALDSQLVLTTGGAATTTGVISCAIIYSTD